MAVITVTLDLEDADAVIYALRRESHRQEPAEYPRHELAYPDYDPAPETMTEVADQIEQLLIEAGAVEAV